MNLYVHLYEACLYLCTGQSYHVFFVDIIMCACVQNSESNLWFIKVWFIKVVDANWAITALSASVIPRDQGMKNELT